MSSTCSECPLSTVSRKPVHVQAAYAMVHVGVQAAVQVGAVHVGVSALLRDAAVQTPGLYDDPVSRA